MEISRVTLGRWVAQGCPQLERGTFDLLDVLNWRGVLNTRDASAIGSGMDEPDDELRKASPKPPPARPAPAFPRVPAAPRP